MFIPRLQGTCAFALIQAHFPSSPYSDIGNTDPDCKWDHYTVVMPPHLNKGSEYDLNSLSSAVLIWRVTIMKCFLILLRRSLRSLRNLHRMTTTTITATARVPPVPHPVTGRAAPRRRWSTSTSRTTRKKMTTTCLIKANFHPFQTHSARTEVSSSCVPHRLLYISCFFFFSLTVMFNDFLCVGVLHFLLWHIYRFLFFTLIEMFCICLRRLLEV